MEPRVLQVDERGTGDPVVLVPGGLTGWVSWAPHQERLASRHRVIRVQPIHNELGSKGSPGDRGYSAEIERESLRLTLDALDLARPHLAGWSGGGLALIEFAIEYPEWIRSLALVEPAAYWVLAQLGERLDEVEQSNAFVHGLFGARGERG
ncbi:MAG: alpha/beta fold hydrolase [bacterium]